MAEPTFDRARFDSRLATRRLGQAVLLRAETSSTNDDAWDAAAAGAADGTVVIADHQSRGRGREGRAWHDAPGHGLALSILLHPGRDRAAFATAPLVAGPPELRDLATSLRLAGHTLDRESIAAAFLNALEPLWDAHREGDGRAALEAWRARARFWGQLVSVRTPFGT